MADRVASATRTAGDRVGVFASARLRRRYWLLLAGMTVAGLLFALGLLLYGNPVPIDSPVFPAVVQRRLTSVVVMLVVAICHALGTVAFQTATNNRLLTPSIMGFEALYLAIQTSTIYFFGAAALVDFRGIGQFLLQIGMMLALSLVLYGWLLSGRFANLQIMLLIGIIIGGGLGSLSTFMQRLLTPSEFDLLTARLFGSVNNADSDYLPIAIPLVAGAAILLVLRARRLDVVALGRDITNNLGLNHRREVLIVLVLVAVLMSVTTALVGPMTFLGFLVATLAYQFTPTHSHRHIFPMAVATAFAVLTGAYFLMQHVFAAQGVVSILIELVGGVAFLVVVLRRRRL